VQTGEEVAVKLVFSKRIIHLCFDVWILKERSGFFSCVFIFHLIFWPKIRVFSA
jgi:hypothetical protein